MAYTYKHPRAALTVDCVVFGFDEGDLKVLLIERGLEPFQRAFQRFCRSFFSLPLCFYKSLLCRNAATVLRQRLPYFFDNDLIVS